MYVIKSLTSAPQVNIRPCLGSNWCDLRVSWIWWLNSVFTDVFSHQYISLSIWLKSLAISFSYLTLRAPSVPPGASIPHPRLVAEKRKLRQVMHRWHSRVHQVFRAISIHPVGWTHARPPARTHARTHAQMEIGWFCYERRGLRVNLKDWTIRITGSEWGVRRTEGNNITKDIPHEWRI